MSKPVFIVAVADLERGPKTVTFTLNEGWLQHALEDSHATPRREGSVTVELSKNGAEVMVRGRLQAALSMPCVVTLDPVDVDVDADIFLMLAPGAGDNAGKGLKKGRRNEPKVAGVSAAPAKHRRPAKDEDDEGEELDDKTAARDTFQGSQIELDSFFREFLILELPLFPRRSDLPSTEGPAIGPPSAETEGQEPDIDPRLLPLAALRSRLERKD